MKVESIINDICCDNRIKNGVFEINNPDHVFILQEYLEKLGLDIETVTEKTAKLFEAGRFPERQAYNKNGILVTFPTKEYRNRAVNKGTHFAENPKKSVSNIFTKDDDLATADVSKPEKPVTQLVDKEVGDLENSDKDTRSPEEIKQDSQAVVGLLTTPTFQYALEEAKSFGFYNKGFLWYDSNGEYIGKQKYDEQLGKSIIVPEAISPAVYLKKAAKVVEILDSELFETLNFLKDADKSKKTLIFETIPILVANGIRDFTNLNASGNYQEYAIDFLKKWGALRSKLEKIENPIFKEENLKIYDLVNKDLIEIGGVGSISLSDLGTPSDFIHKDIKKFYKFAGKYNDVKSGENAGRSKENTADIVLIYGGTADDVYKALDDGQIDQQDVDSLAKVKDKNITFALVSLKAGSARLGHVLQKLVTYVGTEIPIAPGKSTKAVKQEVLSEAVLDTIMNSFKQFAQIIKDIPDQLQKIYKDFIDKIKPFETKITNFLFKELNLDVKRMETSEMRDLKMLEMEIEKDINTLNEDEAVCDKNSAVLKSSLIKNLTSFKKILQSSHEDDRLMARINEFSKNPLLLEYFPIVISKEESDLTSKLRINIISIIDNILKNNKENDCIARLDLQPILKYRSNILALGYVELILDNILKDTSTSSPEKIREDFIKLASTLSSEAVFGNNISLPLIKFTGSKIERLRFKGNYKLEVPTKIDKLKLGKLRINLIQEDGYMTVNLFLFNGIISDDDIPKPTYVNYLMDSSSGSKFSFKIEGQKVVEKI